MTFHAREVDVGSALPKASGKVETWPTFVAALGARPCHSLRTRGLNCHQCKGFGGCLNASRCPWGSNYCVSIGTRVPFSAIDLPLVTKSCYSGCPDIPSLGLGPDVSIVCCQYSLCNTD
ncbi:secreted Ly-6/uPAR domain-containing protein 2-like [Zalophus californianus]|uniref:Secreted Ly-6/uPAR domain-containing protein 2 n=1 Tax=Zalophus californianus TaxID=9704 RepID=A0A6J2FDD6_ZALCA|nr:secreted Ly-6/uPAR domain-containing protein 2-like [Zalophus californianus]